MLKFSIWGPQCRCSLWGNSPCCCCYWSVTQLCPTLCDPINCSTPGFPVLHCLLEFAQTHAHWVGDAIQSSHPLLPSSPQPSIFPSTMVFSNQLALHIRWPKYWNISFSISPSNEYSRLFSLGLTGLISFKFKGLSRVFSVMVTHLRYRLGITI